MTCIGIDLGTTNSLVAYFSEDGPLLVKNALGEYLTPSVVGLADDNKTLLVGKAAKKRLIRFPDKTRSLFKRSIGTNSEFSLGKKQFSATDLSALVLSKLKQDAEDFLKTEISEAVISVPAYFNAVQRQATKDAAEIAGLKVCRLINEPTAAALANGVLDRENESTFVILDLGGGTFDVSILEMFEGVMEVRASSGDAFLGGEDFTEALAKHFSEQIDQDWKSLRSQDKELLLSVADQLKCALEGQNRASATVKINGISHNLEVDNDGFERLTSNLIDRLYRPIQKSLYDAGLRAEQVDRVILVGGATRMSAARSLAAKVFRKLPERNIDPDHAIALGAAVQAGLIKQHTALDDVVMTDVAPFSMGIETNHRENGNTVHGAFAAILERNTVLPASRQQYFETAGDNQTKIELSIYQGESAIAKDNVLLGKMTVPVPPKPAGHESIEVRFTYDVSGLLVVDVKVLSMNSTVTTVIENLAGAMSSNEKKARLKALEKFKIDPREQELNRALLESIKHMYEVLLGDDRAYVMNLLGRFEAALQTQDPQKIEKERAEIEKAIEQIEANFVRH